MDTLIAVTDGKTSNPPPTLVSPACVPSGRAGMSKPCSDTAETQRLHEDITAHLAMCVIEDEMKDAIEVSISNERENPVALDEHHVPVAFNRATGSEEYTDRRSVALDDEIKRKCYVRAQKIRMKDLPRSGRFSKFLEDYHVTGVKMPRPQKRTWKHKDVPGPTKEERFRAIGERRSRSMIRKGIFAFGDQHSPVYEGLLDTAVNIKLEDVTVENFERLFTKCLGKARDAVNNSKLTVEHLMKVDTESFTRALISIVAGILCVAFVTCCGGIPAVFRVIGAGIAMLLVAYPFLDKIRDYVVEQVLTKASGVSARGVEEQFMRDYEELQPEIEREIAELARRQAAAAEEDFEDFEDAYSDMWFGYQGIFDEFAPVVHMITGIAATTATAATNFVFSGQRRNFAETLSKSVRVRNDLHCVLNEALKFIAECIDSLCGTTFRDMFRKNQALDKWSEDVKSVYKEFSAGNMQNNSTNARRVNRLLIRGMNLAQGYTSMEASAWALHRFCMSMISRMEGVLCMHGVPISERPVPLVVCLRGESGIGKSYIQSALIDQIALRVMDKQRRKEFLVDHSLEKYMWLTEEEFANGYAGQFAVMFDDFMQMEVPKGQTDDGMRIIRFANAAPCRLNAAELDRKGKLVFTSPLIVCSTNRYKYWSPSLYCNEALVRRFDVWIDMVPRVEYCTDATRDLEPKKRRLDKRKLGKGVVYDACEYRLLKCTDAKQQTWEHVTTYTFDQLVKHCVDEFKVHAAEHDARMEALAERRREIDAEMDLICEEEAALDEERKKLAAKIDAQENGEFHYEGWFGLERNTYTNAYEFLIQVTKDCCEKVGMAFDPNKVDPAWLSLECEKFLRTMEKDGLASVNIGARKFVRKGKSCAWHAKHFVTQNFKAVKDGFNKFYVGVTQVGIKKWLQNINTWRVFAIAIAVLMGVALVIFGATKIWKWATNKKKKPSGPAEFTYETELERKEGESLFATRMIHSLLDRNVYHMYREHEDPTKETSFGSITMVSGTCGLMNWHYRKQFEQFRDLHDTDSVRIKLVKHSQPESAFNVPISVFLNDDNVSEDRKLDMCLVNFGKILPVCRDIRRNFVTKETISQNRDNETSLYVPKKPKTVNVFNLQKSFLQDEFMVEGQAHSGQIAYKAATENGDCGSLLCYTGNYANFEERIVGVHMGSYIDARSFDKIALASIITQEDLERMLSKFKKQPIIQANVFVEGSFLKREGTCHDVVKVLDRTIFQPTKTSSIPSKLYAAMAEPTKAPAVLGPVLRDGELKDPVVEAHKRQNSYNTVVDPEMLDLVVDQLTRELRKFVPSWRRLSFEEAVKGAADMPYLKGLPRQTSAGFTYLYDARVRKGKRDFFGYDGDYEFDNELVDDLRGRVNKLSELARSGIVPEDRVFMDTLKDETVTFAKIESVKTRMISASDLPLSIWCRMLFGSVCNDLVRTRYFNGIAVGGNPYSKEWELLAKRLQSKGQKVIAGDFAGFDNSQTCQLIRAVMDVMINLTGVQDGPEKLEMESLAVALAQPYHVSGRTVYELDHGMPSGNPMTSIMNSLFGHVAFRLAWLLCVKDKYINPRLALQDFPRKVELQMYGDDNTLNVADSVAEDFNQHTLMKVFPTIGLKYTSDVKDDLNPPPWRTLEECSFLKRGWVYNDVLGRRVAALDKGTILEMLNWTKKGASRDAITLDNCDNAMREWSFHGRAFYEEMCSKLTSAVREKMGHTIFPLGYAEMVKATADYKPIWSL